ncbi:hypothetical protein COBT_001431 [Conglomerata obtusa]
MNKGKLLVEKQTDVVSFENALGYLQSNKKSMKRNTKLIYALKVSHLKINILGTLFYLICVFNYLYITFYEFKEDDEPLFISSINLMVCASVSTAALSLCFDFFKMERIRYKLFFLFGLLTLNLPLFYVNYYRCLLINEKKLFVKAIKAINELIK